MNPRPLLHTLLISLLFAWSLKASATTFAIVSSPSVTLTQTPRTLLNIFLLRQTTDQQAHPLQVFSLNPDNPLFEQFVSQCLHWNPRFLANRWQRNLYTGEGRTPHFVENWQQMKTSLIKTPHAIGFLPLPQLTNGLHLLKKCELR